MKEGKDTMKSKVLGQTFSISLLILLFIAIAYGEDGLDKTDFRNFVTTRMKEWNVPGAAVLIKR